MRRADGSPVDIPVVDDDSRWAVRWRCATRVTVRTAADGAAREDRPDAVVLDDCRMSGLRGPGCCVNSTRSCRFLLLTAKDAVETVSGSERGWGRLRHRRSPLEEVVLRLGEAHRRTGITAEDAGTRRSSWEIWYR